MAGGYNKTKTYGEKTYFAFYITSIDMKALTASYYILKRENIIDAL